MLLFLMRPTLETLVFPADFHAEINPQKYLRILLLMPLVRRSFCPEVLCGLSWDYIRRYVSCGLTWDYIRRYVSCGFYNPQENITHEGVSWEPESLANSAGTGFSVEAFPKSAGQSRIYSSGYQKMIC